MSAGRKNNSHKKDWNTPPKYIIPIKNFFGGQIHLDPCSNEFSLVKAITEYLLPVDGLSQEWNAPKIFVNPPYGRSGAKSIYHWIKKGIESHLKYNSELIFLIPVATNTKHFKELIFNHFSVICFLNDTRLKFFNQGVEDKKGAPMACCLVYLGHRKQEFKKQFEQYGKTFLI